MGCNYYVKQKIDDDLKLHLKQLIEIEEFDRVKELLPNTLIHIGKSSHGWQFLFNHNNWEYFDNSLESLKSFLKSKEIVDEYDEVITCNDFWELVESKKDGLDNKKYYNQNPNLYHDSNFHQEIHFNLFFSDSTEFS